MRKAFSVVAGLLLFTAGDALAQGQPLASPTCPGGAPLSTAQVSQDACQQAYDIYQFMGPQLAAVIAGGNATIGQGSTLGGIGHFSIGVRVNAVQGAYPDVTNYTQSITGAQRRVLATKDQFLPFPTADAAVGLFEGIPLGLTNIFGIDALVSATYVPNLDSDNFAVKPETNLQIGYGGRIGILQESIVVPGLSVTYLRRDLPTTSLQGKAGSNQLNINNLKVQTKSLRVVASKSLVVLGFAIGYGRDDITNSANIQAVVSNVVGSGTATANFNDVQQDLQRNNVFADVSLNLPLFKMVAEAGQVSGGTISTYNSFSGGASDRSLTYFSLGLRFGW